jgi:hypothetical protein
MAKLPLLARRGRCAEAKWSIEGRGSGVFLYQRAKRIPTRELSVWMDEALSVAGAFAVTVSDGRSLRIPTRPNTRRLSTIQSPSKHPGEFERSSRE